MKTLKLFKKTIAVVGLILGLVISNAVEAPSRDIYVGLLMVVMAVTLLVIPDEKTSKN